MNIHPLYTVHHKDGVQTSAGAVVGRYQLKGANAEIPALICGEKGRGRGLGVVPVCLLDQDYQDWQNGEEITIFAGHLGTTKVGKPKIYQKSPDIADPSKAIVVMRTKIGFRGSNAHTGDRVDLADEASKHHEFPGEILATGKIAQGLAGNAGSGEQIIAAVEKGAIFRTWYGGRLYGNPDEHFFHYTGTGIQAVIWEERANSDIF